MVAASAFPEWQSLTQAAHLEVLRDALLFYAIALLLLTYLGGGIAALTLPKEMRSSGWLLAPYLGYSVLVVTYGLMGPFGSNVRTTLIACLVICTAANLLAAVRARGEPPLGPFRRYLLLLALSLPSYAATAVSMAHSGSLAYVGPQRDIDLLVPLTEWLKDHSSPLLSLDTWGLAPYWNGSMPPRSEWLSEGAHLFDVELRYHDVLFLFQRGPRCFDASMGLLLGWDSYLLLRPSLAFMLSLSLPATFLFARLLLGASISVSALAAALVGLNGTLYYWISYGHPGQAAWTFQLPVALTLTWLSLLAPERAPLIATALVLSALPTSYYQAMPLLLVLLAAALTYLSARSGDRRNTVSRVAALGLLALLLTIPEHVKFALVLMDGTWVQPGAPGTRSGLGEALGTALYPYVLELLTGVGGNRPAAVVLLSYLSPLGTALAFLFAILGAIGGRALRPGILRVLLAGTAAVLAYLGLSGYDYGYSKAQALTTFLFATALALGVDLVLSRTRPLVRQTTSVTSARGILLLGGVGVATIVAALTVALAFALSVFVFWKPVGNIWSPKVWEPSSLRPLLPPGGAVRVSPNILADPETTLMAIHFLRDQRLQGTFTMKQTLATEELFSREPTGPEASAAFAHILGASEVAAANGFLPSDQIWSGSSLKAYRPPEGFALARPRLAATSGDVASLPARLPVTIDVQPIGDGSGPVAGSASSTYLLLAMLSDARSTIEIGTSRQRLVRSVSQGLSIRSIPVQVPDRVTLSHLGESVPCLLALHLRNHVAVQPQDEDHPEVLAAVGDSRQEDQFITTRFTYFDSGFPTSHSLDIYEPTGETHSGWFELPTYPDSRIREVRFELNPLTLQSRAFLNGTEVPQRSSTRPLADGEYVAYFSLWSEGRVVKRIPLYRFWLSGGQVADFEAFRLRAVWNARAHTTG